MAALRVAVAGAGLAVVGAVAGAGLAVADARDSTPAVVATAGRDLEAATIATAGGGTCGTSRPGGRWGWGGGEVMVAMAGGLSAATPSSGAAEAL